MKKDKTLEFIDKLFKILDKNYFFNNFWYDFNCYGFKDYVKWYEKRQKEDEDFNKIKKGLDKLIKEYVESSGIFQNGNNHFK